MSETTAQQEHDCSPCRDRRWIYMQPGNIRAVCPFCNADGKFLTADGVDEEALEDWNTFTPQEITFNALKQVRRERARQVGKWGGAEHDDQHTPAVWLDILETRLTKIGAGTWLDFEIDAYREGLVEIAAVAVAAIEQIDRMGEEKLAEHIGETRRQRAKDNRN